jgi:hypothetical protein
MLWLFGGYEEFYILGYKALFGSFFDAGFLLALLFILKMEVTCSFETSVHV